MSAPMSSDRPRRRVRRLVGLTGLALGSVLLALCLEPELRLARAGRLSFHDAGLFRAATSNWSVEDARFFDEVPGALGLYRDWALAHRKGDPNILDRDVALVAGGFFDGGSIMGDMSVVKTLGPEDYGLLRNQREWRFGNGTLPADMRLAVDFERAKTELLARPPHAHALLALLHWGVPASEVRAALPRLNERTSGTIRGARLEERRAFAARLLLEDQSLEDPLAAIRRAGLPAPWPHAAPPRYPWRRSAPGVGVQPLSPDAPLVHANLTVAQIRLAWDPGDAPALAFLHRALRVPVGGFRYSALWALVDAGDPAGLAFLRGEFASANGARIEQGLRVSGSPPTASLLAGLSRHPYLWVRLEAAWKLRDLGALGASALAGFRDDPARDVRRVARGLLPLGIGSGTTRTSLLGPGVGASDPGSPVLWRDWYGELGEGSL